MVRPKSSVTKQQMKPEVTHFQPLLLPDLFILLLFIGSDYYHQRHCGFNHFSYGSRDVTHDTIFIRKKNLQANATPTRLQSRKEENESTIILSALYFGVPQTPSQAADHVAGSAHCCFLKQMVIFPRVAKIRTTLLAPYFLPEKPMKMQMGPALLCENSPPVYRLFHPGPGIQLHYPWSKCRAQGCMGEAEK